ncbi:uncharacterized protein DUF4129 [Motilibacter rhizosphaerae]|uniref:Uncharacterized protein DUF4129 n=1 Tax=Motilibacter rhizosphaerae TaxID=598652 RepID=A0A4Q7NUP2_9ACTN|nr:DUF4129 domain-containing protein [Motilibacter rhizosphaerae]RZS90142.1 uncharacterized protein DUF4129 [Motilibacter rhizosphaerae]
MAVPVELGRAAARELARRELARPEYARDRPGVVSRALRWVLDRAGDLLSSVGGGGGGVGWLGLAALVLLVVGAVVAVRLRTGALVRSAAAPPLFAGGALDAAGHAALADEHARAGRHDLALRERWRALVRGLEEDGRLEPRAGRTVGEAAAEAALAVPAAREALGAAAASFEQVWYAGRPATGNDDALGVAALRAVRAGVRA